MRGILLLVTPVPIDTNLPVVMRAVRVGGVSKQALLAELQRLGIELNDMAKQLFADARFTASEVSRVLETVELSVGDLGFAEGATAAQIYQRAAEMDLGLCPLELAPHLRLQFLDQSEGALGQPPSQHRAPPGSITVASPALADDADFPQGFYLRRTGGVLWLRGYCSGPEHIWRSEDRLVFSLRNLSAQDRSHC